MKIKIEQVKNGYIVTIADSMKDDGVTIYRMTEEFQMLETLGKIIVQKRVQVREL